jgi:hypothetical protein
MKKGTCVHFNGIQHETCEAGLNMRKVTSGEACGWAARMACIQNDQTEAVCENYTEPTDEQIKASNEELDKLMENMKLVYPLISKFKQENPSGGQGEVECPVCKGVMQYSVSGYNLHCHGKCKTEGCLSWME